MIVWSSQPKLVTFDSVSMRRTMLFRKVVEVSSLSIELRDETCDDNQKWTHGAKYWNVSITKHFALGLSKIWYDGMRCSFSLGFIHLNWLSFDGHPDDADC